MFERLKRRIIRNELTQGFETMLPGLKPGAYIRSPNNPDSFGTPTELQKRLSDKEKEDIFKLGLVKSTSVKILKNYNETSTDPYNNLGFKLSSSWPFVLVSRESSFYTGVSRSVLGSSFSPVTLLEVARILRQNGLSVGGFLAKFPQEWFDLIQPNDDQTEGYRLKLAEQSQMLKEVRDAVVAISKIKVSTKDLEGLPQVITSDYRDVAKSLYEQKDFVSGERHPKAVEDAQRFAEAAGNTLGEIITGKI